MVTDQLQCVGYHSVKKNQDGYLYWYIYLFYIKMQPCIAVDFLRHQFSDLDYPSYQAQIESVYVFGFHY